MDLAVPADHKVKIKESEKRDWYLDLAKELRKLWNMKVKVILIVTGALEGVPKVWERGQEGLEIRIRIETLQTICNIMAEGFRFIYLAFRFS